MRTPRKVWGRPVSDAAGMQTNPTYSPVTRVDREELDRQIADMYRDVANEAARDLHFPTGRPLAEALGYPADLLTRLPAQAVNSFAGVGYHLGLARLLQGERVLDLGSGSGMDVFAAATQVGPAGSVTGVDTTPEQLAKSERLRRDEHVRFLHARIEELPFDDASFDAVISNGVINLSADKRLVFEEAARVLRPGGRLAHGVDTEKMFATLDLIKAQPELAKFQFRATNRWIDGSHNRSTIKGFHAAGGEDTTRGTEFVIDAGEPAILLGTDTGANPAEHLLHALAACLTTSIVYVGAALQARSRPSSRSSRPSIVLAYEERLVEPGAFASVS